MRFEILGVRPTVDSLKFLFYFSLLYSKKYWKSGSTPNRFWSRVLQFFLQNGLRFGNDWQLEHEEPNRFRGYSVTSADYQVRGGWCGATSMRMRK